VCSSTTARRRRLALHVGLELGFVATAGDLGNSDRSVISDRYADQRGVASAARVELASLKGQTRAVLERRKELVRILQQPTPAGAKPVQADAQAAAIGRHARAAGWQVMDAAIGTWLSLFMVSALERLPPHCGLCAR